MKLEINYFGQLVELINTSKELIEVSDNCSVKELKDYLLKRHPLLQDKSYKIAVNQKIANDDTLLSVNNEIALLPPFAGG